MTPVQPYRADAGAARELIPFGGGLGGTLQQFACSEALQSFLFVDNSDNF